MGVVEPLTASDERTPDRRRRLPSGLVELDREDDRGPVLVGEQARGTLSEGPRVERAADVGRVDGDAAPPRLRLDDSSPVDEVGHVGDRIADAVPVGRPLEQHRLVEVHAARRIDREERELAQVGAAVRGGPPPGRRPARPPRPPRGSRGGRRTAPGCGRNRPPAGSERRLRQPDTTVRRHVLSRGNPWFPRGPPLGPRTVAARRRERGLADAAEPHGARPRPGPGPGGVS